ncbi:hypothetical protein NWF24_30880 [Variovorax paradoxus]|uniref:hypothetical protein n=1 Tax=Variovorax paradoxus TaxID=34073 RepID=UPI0021ACC983|nr:hypothetical protein [Variovorax paradoxus]UVH57195.1 hypothetical protein NWF24_30880 [Variovorax paradoxus]
MPQQEIPAGPEGVATSAVKVNATKPLSESPLKRLSRSLWWRTHWLLPNLLPSPGRDREYQLKHDLEANQESRVPAEENLRLSAFWAMEIFGPTESDRLYSALETLGWSAGFRSHNEGGALEWVQQQRTYGLGGTYNVGYVTKRADRGKYLLKGNYASLPDEVDHLIVRLHQVVPSVTCVVVCFVMKPEAATRYERELNKDRISQRQRLPDWTIGELDPVHLKQRAMARAREDVLLMAHKWFRVHLPGFFAATNRPERHPAAEFLTTESQALFSQDFRGGFFDWQRILANVGRSSVWTCREIPSLQFTEERARWPHEHRFWLTVNLITTQLPTKQLEVYGAGERAYMHMCHERLEGLLCHFAVTAYLTEVSRDLKVAREGLNVSQNKGRVFRKIQEIQQFFDQNLGIPVAARELVEESKSTGQYRHDCEDFTAPAWGKGEPDVQIAEVLRARVHSLASGIIVDESSTREHFEQVSTILSIQESIRTQRRMELLTIAALLVGLGSLLAALPDKWIANISAMWKLLVN